MHAKRLGAGAFLAVMVTVLFSASAAFAVGSGSVSKNLNITDNELIKVNWTGTTPGSTIVISLCNAKAGTPGFAPAADCFNTTTRSGPTYNATGSGSTGTASLNKDYAVRVDINPAGLGWECGPANVAPDAGNTKYNSCFIRVTENQPSNTDAQFFIPITWDDAVDPGPDPVVPEAPFAVLLPAGAVAVAGAAYFVLRNRRPATAA